MKKRFVTTLLALVASIACLVGLVACGDGTADPVAGKTYVFEKVEITKGASGAVKEEAEASLNLFYAESTLAFDESTFTMTMMGYTQEGTYKQSGSKLTLTADGADQSAKISGDSVKISMSNQGISATLTYKLVKNTENEGGEQGGEQGGQQGGQQGDVLAGKTYVVTEYLMNGTSIFNEMSAYLGEMKMVFDQNGNCTMSSNEDSLTSKYTISGNTLTVTIVEGATQQYEIGNNTLTLTITGGTEDEPYTTTMIFTLQS